jgi:hypothetical protein
MVAFAHLGHWYVQILFAVPSIGIIGFMGRDSLRKRAAAKRDATESSAGAARQDPAAGEASGPVGGYGTPSGPAGG